MHAHIQGIIPYKTSSVNIDLGLIIHPLAENQLNAFTWVELSHVPQVEIRPIDTPKPRTSKTQMYEASKKPAPTTPISKADIPKLRIRKTNTPKT